MHSVQPRARSYTLELEQSHGAVIAVNFTLAEADPSMTDIHILLKRADAALYEAKRRGRNRVVIAGGSTGAALPEAV